MSRPAPAARRELTPEPPSAFQPAVLAVPTRLARSGVPGREPRLSDTEEGPVHRQLIRAQLPRIEGQKDERRPTDFTIRQSGGRGNNAGNQFRGGGGGGGNRPRSGRGGFGGNSAIVGGNAGHGGEWPQAPRRPVRAPGSGSGPGSRPGPRSRSGRRLQVGTAAATRWRPKTVSIARRTLFCYSGGSHV